MTGSSALEVLLAGRKIADHAQAEGVNPSSLPYRASCRHIGAVLADSVLQAGLNYRTVVRPRVLSILERYPDATNISTLRSHTAKVGAATFLNWHHAEKVSRFQSLVDFLGAMEIEEVEDLRIGLSDRGFRRRLNSINGIGPKTVDYMGCLVGLDFIAVDRHVRAFAASAGVNNQDYHFLSWAFCCAADFLFLKRREFDAWLWNRATNASRAQLDLDLALQQ